MDKAIQILESGIKQTESNILEIMRMHKGGDMHETTKKLLESQKWEIAQLKKAIKILQEHKKQIEMEFTKEDLKQAFNTKLEDDFDKFFGGLMKDKAMSYIREHYYTIKGVPIMKLQDLMPLLEELTGQKFNLRDEL